MDICSSPDAIDNGLKVLHKAQMGIYSSPDNIVNDSR